MNIHRLNIKYNIVESRKGIKNHANSTCNFGFSTYNLNFVSF